jgi:hypothetical protein
MEQGTDFNFYIYDPTGRIMMKDRSSSGDISILSLMPGLYLLRIEKNENPLPFIKE